MKNPGILPLFFRVAVMTVLAGCATVSCTSAPKTAEAAPTYRGELQVSLQPDGLQRGCSVTVGLRNVSGTPMGDARLKLAWFDQRGELLVEEVLDMQPTNRNQVDGKNLWLTVVCERVHRLKVRSADWVVGWDMKSTNVVTIEGVEGTEWLMRWDEQQRLFIAAPAEV